MALHHTATFWEDLKKSRIVEQEFATYINLKYSALTEQSPSIEFIDWDVSTTATSKNYKVQTFEVKTQKQYANNYTYFELSKLKNGVITDAGLSATKADYYIIKFENDAKFYCIKTTKLKKLINDIIANYAGVTYIDDGGYLLAKISKPLLMPHLTIL